MTDIELLVMHIRWLNEDLEKMKDKAITIKRLFKAATKAGAFVETSPGKEADDGKEI